MMKTTARTTTGTIAAPQLIRVFEKNAPSEQAVKNFSRQIVKLVTGGDSDAA